MTTTSATVVLITGGARGFGRAAAEELGRAGARVVITGRDEPSLRAARTELENAGATVRAIVADNTDQAATAMVLREVEDTFGPLDVLVNNAGLAGPVGPTWEVDQDAWWQAMEVNLRGTMLTTSVALEHMVPRRRGRIINIVSHAGVHRWPYATAYSVSKAAVIKLTENLALETRRHGITVVSFHPGLLDIGIPAAGAKAAERGNQWEKRIAAWVDRERSAGRMTPVAKATAALRLLVEGAADHRSGEYLTVSDELSPVSPG